jgi:hypothetical protein
MARPFLLLDLYRNGCFRYHVSLPVLCLKQNSICPSIRSYNENRTESLSSQLLGSVHGFILINEKNKKNTN